MLFKTWDRQTERRPHEELDGGRWTSLLLHSVACQNESKAVNYEIGDTFFTTGFDGIHPEGLIVGKLVKITNEKNFFKETLEIELYFDPFKSINKRIILHR